MKPVRPNILLLGLATLAAVCYMAWSGDVPVEATIGILGAFIGGLLVKLVDLD